MLKRSLVHQILRMSRRKAPTRQVASTSKVSEDEETPQPDEAKVAKWEPKNWQETLENLRGMRKDFKAPVDTMGCSSCCEDETDEKTKRFCALVSLMLSSQTKDQVTYEAMTRLKKEGLLPENIVKWETSKLEQLLVPVSFYRKIFSA